MNARNILKSPLSQNGPACADEVIMSGKETFLENASRLFEIARNSAQTGAVTDLSILIGHDGAIRVITASDWPLESLEAHHGSRMAFRVRHTQDRRVRLEGRAGSRTCLLEAAKPDGVARLLLANSISYQVSRRPALLSIPG
jgi:hypothetical protein